MTRKTLKSGFTLLELAIVLAILGTLLYATVKISVGSLNIAKASITNAKLDKIQAALLIYLELNGALPCPADGSLAPTGANFGLAVPTGSLVINAAYSGVTCTGPVLDTGIYHLGVIPSRTLNLPDDYMYDGWGNRVTYAVSSNCLDPDNWATGNAFKCRTSGADTADGSSIVIKDNSNATIASANTVSAMANATYVLISHGASPTGAWLRNGGSRSTALCSTTTGGSAYERDNADFSASCAGATYDVYYRDAAINDGTTSSYFDDIVRWQTAAQMFFIKTCTDDPATCI